MKAVILCAGSGRRLYPLTKDTPKCLLPIGDKRILEHMLDNLKKTSVQEIILVIGYNREKIETLVKERAYQGIEYVVNEKFETTNTAFSLNLALKSLDSDFILLNGDVLFDQSILDELLAHPAENCVVVDNTINLAQEEVKVSAENGIVRRIGKELDPQASLGEAIGINKISHKTIPQLRTVFDKLENRGEDLHFFEKGFDELCIKEEIFGILLTDKPWVEIDTKEDFELAKERIYPMLDS